MWYKNDWDTYSNISLIAAWNYFNMVVLLKSLKEFQDIMQNSKQILKPL